MRVSHRIATLVAVSRFAWAACVFAQGPGGVQPQPAAQSTGKLATSVAVVDIKYIFDNLQGFKAAMDRIKQENEAFEAQVRETEAHLRKKIEELKAMTPGSDQFKQVEEYIAQTRTQVQLDIGRKQKERVENEAKVYHRAYQDVEQQIRTFAERYGIDLVLQYSSTEIDPSKPDTVIRGLNRLVVYHRNLDITKHVLAELNRMSPAAVPPQGVTAPNRPGPAARTAFPPTPGTTRK